MLAAYIGLSINVPIACLIQRRLFMCVSVVVVYDKFSKMKYSLKSCRCFFVPFNFAEIYSLLIPYVKFYKDE